MEEVYEAIDASYAAIVARLPKSRLPGSPARVATDHPGRSVLPVPG